MTYGYKVVVDADPYTWTAGPDHPLPRIAGSDAVDWDAIPNGYLADPLTITRSIPEDDFWPGQPAPAVVRFSIIAQAYADVADLEHGQAVQVRFHSPSDAVDALEDFAGRISALVIRPHQLGIIADVTCVDYLADLADIYSPGNAPFYKDQTELVEQVWDNASFYPAAVPATPVFDNPDLLPLPADPQCHALDGGQLPAVLDVVLSQWILEWTDPDVPAGPARPVLVQRTTGPDLDNYALVPIWRTPDDAPLEIAAAHVDVGGSFTRRTGSETIGTIEASYLDSFSGERISVYASTAPLPRATKWTALADTTGDPAQAVCDFYLPSPGARWVGDAFTWRLYAEPAGTYLLSGYGGQRLAYPIDITGVDVRWNPGGATYSGLLAAYTLTIAAGRPMLALTLHPEA